VAANVEVLLAVIQGLFGVIAAVVGALVYLDRLPRWATWVILAVVTFSVAAMVAIAFVSVGTFPKWAAWALPAMATLLIPAVAGFLLGKQTTRPNGDSRPPNELIPPVQRSLGRRRWTHFIALLFVIAASVNIASVVNVSLGKRVSPSVSIAYAPPAGEGGPDNTYPIFGKVSGVESDRDKVVVFALAANTEWYVQPTVESALTNIQEGEWHTFTHSGREYAALLVKPSFHLPANPTGSIPSSSDVLAVTVIPGTH
jgi:hypothetical protein